MATLVLTSATVLVGTAWTGTAPGPGNPTVSGTITSSTDYSTFAFTASLDLSTVMQDFTTFGDGGYTTSRPGLKSGALSIAFNQDFASGSVDAIFAGFHSAGTLVYFDVKPTSAARGTSNPSYVFAGYVNSYVPIGQTVGDKATVTVPITVTGTYARLTA